MPRNLKQSPRHRFPQRKSQLVPDYSSDRHAASNPFRQNRVTTICHSKRPHRKRPVLPVLAVLRFTYESDTDSGLVEFATVRDGPPVLDPMR
jgi:hypothetical protein